MTACQDTPPRPGSAPVPLPDLSGVEAAVRGQLETAQAELQALLDERTTEDERLGKAFGEMGQRYQLYKLHEAAAACYENARVLEPGELRWAYYLGTVYQTLGREATAAELFDEALALRGDYLPARVRLGEVRTALNQQEGARAALTSALELDPDCALAHYFLGQLDATAGDHAAAAERFERVLELQPVATAVHYSLAQAYRGLGERERAAEHLERIGNRQEVRLADPLIHELDDLGTGAAVHIRRAGGAQLAGDFAAAREEYRKAVEIDPQNPEARQGLGLMLAQTGDRAAGVAEFRAAWKLDPENPRIHYNLAGLLLEDGAWEEAVGHYETALALDSDYANARWALAKTLAANGRHADAAQRYQQILNRDPQSIDARIELGAVLIGAGEHEKAFHVEREVLELDPTDEQKARALTQLAVVAFSRGAEEEAVGRYHEAIALAPEMVEAHFGLANLLGRLLRFREAAEAYEVVLEARPDHLPARLAQATAFLLAGDAARSLATLEEGLRVRPGDVDLGHTLARLLATSRDAAVRDGARALELAQAVHAAAPALESAETLAMALAELGRFDEAVRWQRQILDQIQDAPPPIVERIRHNLELYEKQQAVRR